MATTGTTALANEIKPLYDAEYYFQGQNNVYFDQLANLKVEMNGVRGTSVNFPIVESGIPQPTQLDELEDVVPQKLQANEVSITIGEYGGAVEVTKLAAATSYADIYEQAAWMNAYSMAETVDLVARAVFCQGSRVFLQNGRASRAILQGQQTAADRVTMGFFELASTLLARATKMPLWEDGTVCTVLHPFVFYDLLQQTDPRAMAIRLAPEVLFNGELGYWGGMRIVVSGAAKGFWGAGAVAASSLVTTLSTAIAPGDTNIKVASVTTVSVGQWVAIIDAAETGNTWSDTNELFYVTTVGTLGAGGTGLTGFCLDPGPGDAGGFRYAHASGTVVNNNNSVFPVPIIGPNSVTKVCSDMTGPYGETVVVGPLDHLGRFKSVGWYLLAGYGRTRQAWLFRLELGSSQT